MKYLPYSLWQAKQYEPVGSWLDAETAKLLRVSTKPDTCVLFSEYYTTPLVYNGFS